MIFIALVTFFGISRLKLDENIYSIFPQGEEFKKFSTVLKENNLNKQIIFSIEVGNDQAVLLERLDSLSELVIEETSSLVVDFEVIRKDQQELILEYFYQSMPSLFTEQDYVEVEKKIGKDSIHESMDLVYSKMTSPNSFFIRKLLAKDPLGLAWNKLQSLRPQSDSNPLTVEDGILFTKNKERALFTAVLNFDLDNNVKNEELNLKLIALKNEINRDQTIGFDYFGTFQISYENSRQVKEDTFLTLLISFGLILLLLIVYYRSIVIPIFFVLPALFAGFCGLGLVGFIQPEISAISIATSAVLLGIVLDYSFHFFTHYNASKNSVTTVKELSFPMLVGSFTTVAAFSALMFTDSVVLQNFGLIALCTLSSAVIFTLLLLPRFLNIVNYVPLGEREVSVRSDLPKWVARVSIWLILILTVVFFLKANGFKFDSDLNNLSYHPDELAEKEEALTGINPKTEKKVYLFVTGKTKADVELKNYQLYLDLELYKKKHGLEEVISIAPYAIPNEIISRGRKRWQKFWNENKTEVLAEVGFNAAELDFSTSAFVPFENWILQKNEHVTKKEERIIQSNLGLENLVYSSEKGWNIITSIVIKKDQLGHFKKYIQNKNKNNIYIFDIAEMANALMTSVQEDFNYLLIFSSLIVLLSLLVIYGRIELALFAFLPMVVSWIWILGISSMFDLKFNFVNIIVATFIFGLGDDFSIFVTDGLLQKYKSNSNALKSFKSAIVLSGITTIIGTGVLYFSKHPAIHSIAVISVVGIACILIVTLAVQPAIFRFFITNRTKNKRSPVTFTGLMISIFLFIYFLIGSLSLTLFLLLLVWIPVSRKRKRQLMNFLISKLAMSTIYLGIHVKKRILNQDRLDFSKPSIIVANHSSFLDILLMIMLNPRVIIMVKKWVYNSPVFGIFIRYSGYVYVAEGAEYNLALMQQRVNEGYSIVIFPEGTRSIDGEIKRFHKGAFYLAQVLKLDIQPIVIIGANYVNPKNDFIIKRGVLTLSVMPRISVENDIYKESYGSLSKYVVSEMRSEKKHTTRAISDTEYLKKRVQYNYLYKGPTTEWYVRIKWRFERKNYDYYNSLIDDRKRIYDIGCGLGYMSYFLHYSNVDRFITGVDYDQDKIAIAQNGYDKTENLNFCIGDVRSYTIENADVVFYNDVLHYLTLNQQMEVLNDTVDALNDNGIIFIRDGITDMSSRHGITETTEKYSTSIFGFNKTTESLSFFSSEDIYKFAKKRDLKCEMIEQSQKTSNVLFVLSKTSNGK